MRTPKLLILVAFALLTSSDASRPAGADTLLLTDGRTVECPKAEKQADGSWKLSFQNGDIVVPAAQVKDAFLTGAAGAYEPKNDEEREKVAKGLVPYEGKWISVAERTAKLAKRAAEAKKRIEEAKAHREWRNRYKAKTANFEFEYTIPPEVAKGFMDLMETYYSVFTKQFAISKPKEKLKVCFYHDYETFLEVSGASYGVLAYYRFVEPRELNFYYDRLRPEETTAIMFHEAQHYLSHLMNLKFHIPHNFSEAFAEYYGGSTWDAAKKAMGTGGLQEGRLTEIQTDIARGERKPLLSFLRNELGYEDYTWGWSFVHFLMESPKYQKKFKQFYLALPNGKDIVRAPFQGDMTTVESAPLLAAFQKYMGVDDIPALEKEWYDHIDKNLKVQSVIGLEEAAFAAASTGRSLRARRLFKEAVDKGSKNPVVYLRYGELLRGTDNSGAEAMFRKGLEIDPLNAELYTELGRTIRGRGGEANEKEGKRLILLAAELDPENVETQLLVEAALEKLGAPAAPTPGSDKSSGCCGFGRTPPSAR
jgi:hypothetical protein